MQSKNPSLTLQLVLHIHSSTPIDSATLDCVVPEYVFIERNAHISGTHAVESHVVQGSTVSLIFLPDFL